jgi:nitrite reductase/ring-hydroxylating ferredoxin subunit
VWRIAQGPRDGFASVAAVAERELTTVARVEDLEPGSVIPVHAGEQTLALARVGDDFYAVEGRCCHLQGPLGEGRLDENVLSCPWHGWQYDVRTGENEFDRAIRLETFDVVVEDGDVNVAL